MQKCWIKENRHPLAPHSTGATPYTALCTAVEYLELVLHGEYSVLERFSSA